MPRMVRLRSFLSVVICLFASLPALASIHVWTGAADSRFSNPATVIGGTGGITLRGGGHLIYTGSQPNTYSGLTQVLFGELQLKKAPNVTAIAGDVDVESDGFNYEYGYLGIFNDEQIANNSHVTLG